MKNYDPNMPILRQMLALSIITKLEECGFELLPNPRGAFGLKRPELAERIYVRNITDDGTVRVKVFTTVIGGDNDVPLEVRREGKDAIRVCATYTTKDGKDRGLLKETRVNRTGNMEDIVDRMYQRMRSAWKGASTGEKCHKCGAPKFTTKAGKLCCAEICWRTEEEKKRDEEDFRIKSAAKRARRSRHRRYSRF